MSLRAFHIVFIVGSILMSLLVGGWGVWDYRGSGNMTHLSIGILSLGGAIVLVSYSRWFLRKSQFTSATD